MAFITPVSHSQSDYSRALRAKSPHVSFLLEANKALRAIASVVRVTSLSGWRRPSPRARGDGGRGGCGVARAAH